MLPSLLTCLKDLMRFATSVSAKTKSLCRAESQTKWLPFLLRDSRRRVPIGSEIKFMKRHGLSGGFKSFSFRTSAIEIGNSVSVARKVRQPTDPRSSVVSVLRI